MVKGTTHAILGQAQFRPPARTLPQKVGHWIAQQLSSLFSGSSTGGGVHLPPDLIVVIVAAALVIVLVAIARHGGFRRRWRRDPQRSPAVMVSTDELGVADDVWLGRAVAAEVAGDWREGVRCRYRSLIAVLVATGALSEAIGRTAGEYRSMVERAVPDAAAPFGLATDTFEEAWYGQVPAGPEQRDVLVAAAPPVIEAARRHRRSRHDDPGSGADGQAGPQADPGGEGAPEDARVQAASGGPGAGR
ncbi:MAG: DUF4129 domain-containing protein [Actinomycetota bacterium]|nr:DUF4129 domain-containing protein [Actinomycetota bacterium]